MSNRHLTVICGIFDGPSEGSKPLHWTWTGRFMGHWAYHEFILCCMLASLYSRTCDSRCALVGYSNCFRANSGWMPSSPVLSLSCRVSFMTQKCIRCWENNVVIVYLSLQLRPIRTRVPRPRGRRLRPLRPKPGRGEASLKGQGSQIRFLVRECWVFVAHAFVFPGWRSPAPSASSARSTARTWPPIWRASSTRTTSSFCPISCRSPPPTSCRCGRSAHKPTRTWVVLMAMFYVSYRNIWITSTIRRSSAWVRWTTTAPSSVRCSKSRIWREVRSLSLCVCVCVCSNRRAAHDVTSCL